jgi:hypothetical protein
MMQSKLFLDHEVLPPELGWVIGIAGQATLVVMKKVDSIAFFFSQSL